VRPLARIVVVTASTGAVLVLGVVLGVGAGACEHEGGPAVVRPELPPLDAVPPGAHELDRLQYNDTNDVYRAFLAGKPKGTAPLRLRGVRLALLTEAQIAAGQKPHLIDDGKGPLAYLGPRFKIGVLHGVVEERMGPDAKRPENVVARMERRIWAPFLVAKNVNGKSVWHTPAVHYPPPLAPGPLLGSGASGPTREVAWDNYRRANGVLPQAVRLENEGYTVAVKGAPDDDAPDDAKADAGPAAVAAGPAAADAGPDTGARDNRIIGAVAGSKASEIRKKLRAEERKKQLDEARRNRKMKAKPTP
jgi:hypothetical protein